MIWLSLYDGYAYYRDCLRDYRLAQATIEERLQKLMQRGQVTDNPWGAWEEIHGGGYLIHKPPTPVSVFVRGIEPTLGRSFTEGASEGAAGLWLKWSPVASDPMLGVAVIQFTPEVQLTPAQWGRLGMVVLTFAVYLTTFTFDKDDPLSDVLARNAIFAVNLVLMAVVGFACAFVGILRYDVR